MRLKTEVFIRKRNEAGLSLRKMGGECGVCYATIRRLEMGFEIYGSDLIKIMKYFNLKVEDVI